MTLLANQKFKQSLMLDYQWQWNEWWEPSTWTSQQWQWESQSSWTRPQHTGKRWHPNPVNPREVQLRRHIDQKWEREKRRRQKKREQKAQAAAAEQEWQEAEEWAKEETEAFEMRAKAEKEKESEPKNASEQKHDDPKKVMLTESDLLWNDTPHMVDDVAKVPMEEKLWERYYALVGCFVNIKYFVLVAVGSRCFIVSCWCLTWWELFFHYLSSIMRHSTSHSFLRGPSSSSSTTSKEK